MLSVLGNLAAKAGALGRERNDTAGAWGNQVTAAVGSQVDRDVRHRTSLYACRLNICAELQKG